MKGHIDHCQVIKMNNPPTENIERYIHLDNRYYLYKSKHIDYTLVVYENDEFTGGDLVFADGYRIKAIKNTYIFFDAREYHMVERVNGKRISSVYSIILT
jgi:predicted 2-oxoglutarate/Fe(II)-dependent dioxygenase YbiX